MRKRAVQAMLVSQMDDPQELQGFILLMFGYQNMLSKKNLIAKLQSNEGFWIFHASEIKRRMSFFLNEEVLIQMGF